MTRRGPRPVSFAIEGIEGERRNRRSIPGFIEESRASLSEKAVKFLCSFDSSLWLRRFDFEGSVPAPRFRITSATLRLTATPLIRIIVALPPTA
jgi:hypothetical protein